MKKFLFILTNCLLLCYCIFNKSIYAKSKYTLMTTNGIYYDVNDVVLYESDIVDVDFTTDQECIDYVYSVGYNRVQLLSYNTYNTKLNLTEAEKKLFWEHPLKAFKGYQCSIKAKEKTLELFGYNTDGSKANAFQHAYWIGLMCVKIDPSFAIEEGDAHEEFDSNEKMNKQMDLHNDDVAYNACKSYSPSNDDVLTSYIYSLVTDGKLIYIIRNYQYVKEKIYYITTGRIEYIYSTGDFFCYTNGDIPYGIPVPIERKYKYELMEALIMEV